MGLSRDYYYSSKKDSDNIYPHKDPNQYNYYTGSPQKSKKSSSDMPSIPWNTIMKFFKGGGSEATATGGGSEAAAGGGGFSWGSAGLAALYALIAAGATSIYETGRKGETGDRFDMFAKMPHEDLDLDPKTEDLIGPLYSSFSKMAMKDDATPYEKVQGLWNPAWWIGGHPKEIEKAEKEVLGGILGESFVSNKRTKKEEDYIHGGDLEGEIWEGITVPILAGDKSERNIKGLSEEYFTRASGMTKEDHPELSKNYANTADVLNRYNEGNASDQDVFWAAHNTLMSHGTSTGERYGGEVNLIGLMYAFGDKDQKAWVEKAFPEYDMGRSSWD